MAGKRRSFGGIRKTAAGRFQAYYSDPTGRRQFAPSTFETKREAEAFLASVQTDLERGSWRRPDLARQRIDGYAVEWLKGRTDLKVRTRDLYASLLDRHILPRLGTLELRQLDPQRVRTWFNELESDGVGATARARAYALLRTIMNEAVRDGAVVANPCMIRGASQTKHAERKPATADEVAEISEIVPDRYRLLILMGAYSGLRFGELAALRRGDVDVKAMTVRVERTLHRVGGKWVETAPKSDAGARLVHLPPHLADPLKTHMRDAVAKGADALVFTCPPPRGDDKWTPGPRDYLYNRTATAMFKRAAAKVGRPDLVFHSLRHTGATFAAHAGATTRELMARMGHSTSRAALIYQHATEDRDRAIAAAMSVAATADNVVALRPRERSA